MQRIVVMLLILFVASALSCSREKIPLLGREPVKNLVEMEEQSNVLIDWAQKGYKGMTLIHVDAHDDLGFIPEDRLREMARLIKAGDWDGLKAKMDRGDNGLFNQTNYLYAAVHLGIVKEIYWIVPTTLFEQAGGGVASKEILKRSGSVKDHAEIDKMLFSNGCLSGNLKGALLHVCGADTIPMLKEPVILAIDLDFFPVYAGARRISMLKGFKLFYDLMREREYRVAWAGMAYSINSGYLSPLERYIGSQLREALSNPDIMQKESAPELWLARDTAGNMLSGGEKQGVIDSLREPLKKYPEDAGLRALEAAARFSMGSLDEALTIASDLCRKDRKECGLLLYFGSRLGSKTDADKADAFYTAALAARPDWAFASKEYGQSFLQRKRYREALRHFEAAARVEDDMQLRLRMGEALYGAADTAAALQQADIALKMYDERIGLSMDEETMKSLNRMADLYTRVGRPADAGRIQGILHSRPLPAGSGVRRPH